MKKLKQLAALLLALCLFAGILPQLTLTANAASIPTEAQFAEKIATLKQEYPSGKYWSNKNGTVESGKYKGTSLVGSTACSKSYTYSSNCGTFVLSGSDVAYQCHGFALLLAHKIFGSNANTWEEYTSKSRQIHAGDVVRLDVNGNGKKDTNDHTIFVYKVTSSYIYYADCNKAGPCKINWGKKTVSEIQNDLLYIRHLTDNTLTGSGADTPVLSVKYHANGGTIPNSDVTGYTYKVTEDDGLTLRKGAGTSYTKIKVLSKGTTFNVNVGDTKTADGYTWGKTTVGSDTGWIVISQYVSKTATLRAASHYLSSSYVYKTSNSAMRVTNMTYGVTVNTGLCNDTTFGLIREGYKFVGWSLSTDGGTIIDQDQAIKPEEIVPDLKNGSKTVTVYAIWEESNPANITLSFDANGGSGAMEGKSYIKGDSVTLPESQFIKEGHSFTGWAIQRSDGLWYTDKNTWAIESVISDQSYSKKVFASGESISLESPLVAVSGDHSYTLYAQWRNDSIQSIQLTSIGKDNVYYVGDALNTANIRLMVGYADGSFETITEGFTCTPTTLSKEGKETITVTYGPLTTTYTVQVTKAKTSKANGTGKSDSKGYLLPSTSAGTIAGQGVWKNDSVHVLCKDGNFYLAFIPWGATSVSASNRVLLYLPTSAVTVSGSVPLASDYYSLNPTGQNNATVNTKVYAYHRTDGGATAVTYGDTAYTKMGPLAAGARVKVLFELDGYYCVQTSSYTGFVAKSAITLDAVLCGIRADLPTEVSCLTAEKGKEIDTSSVAVTGIYSDGKTQTLTGYEINLPSTASAGLKYAEINYGGFYTFIPVQITAPEITAISVSTNPNKIKFAIDEDLDLSGLTISVEYEDGSTEIISQDYVTSVTFSETGYSMAEIEYMGFKTYLPVFIYDSKNGSAIVVTDGEGNKVGSYISLMDALSAAEAGQNVSLHTDMLEDDITIAPGVTLDLNGYELIVDSVLSYSSSAVVDTSEEARGILKITDAEGNLMSPDNAQLPVYDDEAGGYRFFAMDVQSCTVTGGNKYWFKIKAEKFAPLYELIQADSDVQIKVKMVWDGQTEDTYAAAGLSFTKTWAESCNENEDIYITVTVDETESVENFKLIPMITSAGVEISGKEM